MLEIDEIFEKKMSCQVHKKEEKDEIKPPSPQNQNQKKSQNL